MVWVYSFLHFTNIIDRLVACIEQFILALVDLCYRVPFIWDKFMASKFLVATLISLGINNLLKKFTFMESSNSMNFDVIK